jgi:hypothetical protein
VTRLEKVADAQAANTFELQYTRWDYLNNVQQAVHTYPLIRNLKDAHFTLEYDVGPRLLRATIDLAIKPDDVSTSATNIHTEMQSPVLRLVASATPRRLDE